MVGCSCCVCVATQAGSVRTRNGDTLNMTPLADMWLIHRLVPHAMHQITVRISGWNWRHPGRSATIRMIMASQITGPHLFSSNSLSNHTALHLQQPTPRLLASLSNRLGETTPPTAQEKPHPRLLNTTTSA